MLSSYERHGLLSVILQAKPLGLFWGGKQANQLFDDTLRILSVPAPEVLVMTRVSSCPMNEAVEEFLSSMCPAEDRWDDWMDYLLLCTRDACQSLEEAVSGVQGFSRV